jgi:hypothetical protein
MKRTLFLSGWVALMLCLSLGCGQETGEAEVYRFYTEKTAAVNEAARSLAAAQNTEQAATELDKGYKILREAVAQEEFLFHQHPRAKETPEVQRLQEDYLAASEKFSREVEALPARLAPDQTLIEALHKMGRGDKPL